MQFQKSKGYPIFLSANRELMKNDISNCRQFKIVAGSNLAGIFSITREDKTIWGLRDNHDAVYLHRIVMSPGFRGQRLFATILDWANEYAIRLDRPFLRMDTWADNPKLIKYYESYGFRCVDTIVTPDSDVLPVSHRKMGLALLQRRIEPAAKKM